MRKCLHVDQIYLYIESELPPEEKEILESHVSSCSKCRNAVAERERLHKAIQTLPLWDAPPGFAEKVMDSIFPQRVSFGRWIGTTLSGISIACLTLLVFYILSGQNFSNIFISFFQNLLSSMETFPLLLAKSFKLIFLLSKFAFQFIAYLVKGISLWISIVSPGLQIILTVLAIFFTASFFFALKKGLLLENTYEK